MTSLIVTLSSLLVAGMLSLIEKRNKQKKAADAGTSTANKVVR
ncbi:hypothetical protein ABC620_01785 [Latilactobacillus sakei]|nr:protein of unknown function [Latilactobacillus sakei]